MAIDTQVPAWLQPPSETERRQLELQEQAVAAKASSMLRKNIGFARMKAQAAQMTANGWDENTARKKALLDNAELIFSDNPEAVANIMQSDEANAIRERSAAALERWRDAQATNLERERYNPEITVVTDPLTGKQASVFKSSLGSAQLMPGQAAQKAAENKLSDVDRAKLTSLYAEMRSVNAELAKIPAAPSKDEDDEAIASRTALVNRKSQIQKQINKIGAPPTKTETEPKPASGRITVVSPSGKRGTIPASQLDEALREGYQQVE